MVNFEAVVKISTGTTDKKHILCSIQVLLISFSLVLAEVQVFKPSVSHNVFIYQDT